MKQRTIELATPWISLDAITPFLPQNPVIVEAGAHSGKDTLRLKKKWPESTIHTFEPLPLLYKQLRERTKHYPDIFYYNVALSDTTGVAQMHVSSGRTDACSSLLEPHHNLTEGRPDIIFNDTIMVTTTTLDTWAHCAINKKIDFLWLDLQGAELKALQGAQELLKTVKAIHTEINEAERYIGGVLYPELCAFLASCGFYPHIKAVHTYAWGNALFVKNS